MENRKKQMLIDLGFGPEIANVEKGLCAFCSAEVDVEAFRDEISKREYQASGLCQKCQDQVFNTPS